jgi:hypothetical protein
MDAANAADTAAEMTAILTRPLICGVLQKARI